jgi:hypothetical protein
MYAGNLNAFPFNVSFEAMGIQPPRAVEKAV